MGYKCETLPPDDWPAGDRARWAEANRLGDPVEGSGRAAHWSGKTRCQVAKDYGRCLYWLRANGWLDPDESPGERLTRSRLGDYVAHLRATGMASTSLLSRIRGLRQAIRVMDPSADLSCLRSLCTKFKARAVPRRKKHLRLVDPAVIVEESLTFYDALVARELTIRRCNHARDALMLAFLAYRPLRLASFAALELGRNLLRTQSGLVLKLEASDLKERRPYDCAIPDDLVPCIDHYLADVRPRLLRGMDSQHLWVSMRGSRMSDSSIYYQVRKITRRLLGRALCPHLLRDCLMSALAADAPESVRAGARILGHGHLSTSEQHYNHATAMSAQRRHFELIREWRRPVVDEPQEEEVS